MEPLHKVQLAPLRTRLYWCSKSNVYICGMSMALHVLHITNFEYMLQSLFGGHALVIKPLEYLLTCPIMMVTLVVLAGDAVSSRRQLEASGLTVIVLLCGFFSSLTPSLKVKLMFFSCGVGFFLMLINRINMTVHEHSDGKESLLKGGLHGTVYKNLALKVLTSWILFPVWWLLSNEGLGIVSQPEVNILVAAALNIFAKGLYVVYLQKIHDVYIGSDCLLEKPRKQPYEVREAMEAAARLGPNGAIAAMRKSIEKEQEAIRHVEQLVLRKKLGEASSVASTEGPDDSPAPSADSWQDWRTPDRIPTDPPSPAMYGRPRRRSDPDIRRGRDPGSLYDVSPMIRSQPLGSHPAFHGQPSTPYREGSMQASGNVPKGLNLTDDMREVIIPEWDQGLQAPPSCPSERYWGHDNMSLGA
eukprot:gnl/TRDRNA2_/TRDRNA2_154575_c4_seq3.p1 gnl/TRDRNA2_/TRDRNA2_154575_c4~~gnl/TRDRNA2_/TRDRNA2_154575_c4_seq3.p1  ORF type:complete len:462 (-),score=56.06 gnl/TRDRNA2_/TRDRNA2_154575_c4_seq3:133-1377(-)